MARKLPTIGRRPAWLAATAPAQGKPPAARAADHERGNSAQRGYDRQWRKTRALWLAQHPLCVECEQRGQYTPATLIDHIRPVQSRDDPLFFDTDNFQSLCRACHARKTAADRASGLTRKPVARRVHTHKP